MKKVIIALAALMVTAAAYGQGTVIFNNRIIGTVDSKVFLPSGVGVGAGFTAQLYGGAEGTAVGALKALDPKTDFRTSAAAAGYVNQPANDVTVPGVPGGSKATLVMKVFNGATYETSTIFGTSAPFTVALGGGGLPPAPPAALAGLASFTLIPEPSTIALGILGAAALLFRRRK